MSIKRSILFRVRVASLGIVGVSLVIIYQIIYLQFVQGKQWKSRAEENGLQYRISKATRGNIYGDEQVLLATSIPLYRLSMDPTVVSDPIYRAKIDSLSRLLSGFFKDLTPIDYLRKINDARLNKRKYIVLNTKLLSFTQKKKLAQWPIFRRGQNSGGVLFEKVEKRSYPFDSLAARTVGYLNDNQEGVGLEISYQDQLSGLDGRALYQRISGGDWKPIRSGSRMRPEDGNDLYCTININIQDIAHKALRQALIKNKAEHGCVVIMDVQTGEIKAMANLGKVEEGQYEEIYNYAVGAEGSHDPGSTIKTASMMALLSDTSLTLRDSIETGGGSFRYYDLVMKDSRYGGWGKITVQQALEYSSNIGVSKLVSRHFGRKPEKFIQYLDQFHLYQPLRTPILEGSVAPYIKDPKDPTWSGITLPWMSVGYEMRLSPLQLLAFYNAIANGGYYVEPMLVKQISKTGEVLEAYQPKVSKSPICSPETLLKIQTMLRGVVERGTAKNIKTPKYAIAGKTGTSQKLNARGRYIEKYKTSFAGYFPANQPKYSCIVVIDEPKGADQYGSDVSAPVFRQIADKLYAQDVEVQHSEELVRETSLFKTDLPENQVSHVEDLLEICNQLGIRVMSPDGQQWVSPTPRRYVVEWKPRQLTPNRVPDVLGFSLRDALYLLENQGLKVKYNQMGRVKSQSLRAGALFQKGDLITLELE